MKIDVDGLQTIAILALAIASLANSMALMLRGRK